MHRPEKFPPPESVPVARRRLMSLAFGLACLAMAGGCGKKGPLYHPPEPASETEPAGEGETADEREEQQTDDTTSMLFPAPGSRLA